MHGEPDLEGAAGDGGTLPQSSTYEYLCYNDRSKDKLCVQSIQLPFPIMLLGEGES